MAELADGLPIPRRHWATLAIMATMVLVVLDGAIANVALPTIAASLQISAAPSIWVVGGYQLALVMALLPCAALGESLGMRRVFIGGIAIFTGTSLLCSLSPSLPWLVASYIALPFYLQHSLNQDAFMTGLSMTPWPLVVGLAGPVSGRLADRMSNGLLCAAGGAFLALDLGLAAIWPIHGTLWPLVVSLMLCGLGFGIFQTPNNRNMMLSAPHERSGATVGMQGTARLLGETTGSVIMALLFTLTSPAAAPRIGLAVGAVRTLAAGFVSVMQIRG